MSGSERPEQMARTTLSDTQVRELLEDHGVAGREHVQLAADHDAGVTRIRSFDRDIHIADLIVSLPYPWPGWYGVQAAGNRLAAAGAAATHLSALILLPEQADCTPTDESLRAELLHACSTFFIKPTHIETILLPQLNSPLLLVTALGEQMPAQEREEAEEAAGDQIVLAGPHGLETAALLAARHAGALARAYDSSFVGRCRDFVRFPGLSALRLLALCRAQEGVSHVVLVGEDGVLGAAHELAEKLACASIIHEGALTPEPEAKLICDHFGLDPMHAPSEGNVLAVVGNEVADTFVQTMLAMKIPAVIIGELKDGGSHLLDKDAYSVRLPAPNRKPLLKLLQ